MNFVITLVVLNFLLIRPIRDIISKRNGHMSGMVDATEKFTADADAKLRDYQKQLDAARQEGTAKRNGLKDEGTVEEKGILATAGAEASSRLKSERETVASEVDTAMTGLKAQVGGLADKVADKVLS